MKRKGITIWEQHVEHIVLGVAVLFLVGFGAMQFLASPNQKSHGGSEIAPSEIDELARQKARDLQSRLDSGSGANLDLPEYATQREAFLSRLGAGVSPSEQIAANHPGQRVLSMDVAPAELASYHVPRIQAPEPMAPSQFFDELQASVVEAIPDLQDRFEAEPYDLSWITAAAVIDLDAVRAEFARTEGDESALPPNWHDGRLDILDVVVERETLRNGAWSELTTLDPLPDMLSFRTRLADEVQPSKSLREEILGQLRRGGQILVAQPPFYETVANAFVPPEPGDDALVGAETPTGEAAEIVRLRQRLRSDERRKESMLQRLTGLGGSWTPGKQKKEDEKKKEEERQERETGGGGGGAGFGGAGGPGGGRRQQGERRGAPGSGAGGLGMSGGESSGSEFGGGSGLSQEKTQELITNLQRQLDRQQERIDRVKADLEKLTGVEEEEREEPVGAIDAMAADELVVWAHDMTAEPGVSYRYRFSVQFYNPFFARKLDLLPEQQELADPLTIASATSQWSAPHRVLRPQKMFVVSAEATDGDIGLGTATIEVFRFFDGAWWERRFVVQPGERIGGMAEVEAAGSKVSIDFATEWYLLDVMPDLDAPSDRDARVIAVVQRLEGGSPQAHDPVVAAADPERTDLREKVQEAEAARTDEKPDQSG